MSSVSDMLREAFRQHQAGNVPLAGQLCDELLRADLADADALHLLGLLAMQLGRFEAARQAIGRALERRPDFAEAHANLGIVLQQQGESAAAIASWQQALRLRPDIAELHGNLGLALLEQGQLDQAAAHLHEALRLKPTFAVAHNHLGSLLKRQGRLAEAVACFQRAIELRPDDAGACLNLAVALREQRNLPAAAAWFEQSLRRQPNYAEAYSGLGLVRMDQDQLDQAEACFQAALRLQPELPDAHLNLGLLLQKRGQPERAIACYEQALRLKPGYAEAYNNLGLVRQDLDDHEGAIASFRQALRLQPSCAEAHFNLGISLIDQRRFADGLACYQDALRFRPDYPDAHYNRSLIWLQLGNFAQGWPEYEWRWHVGGLAPPRYPQPSWDGSPLAGRTILLHAEQGFGDTLQFIRYARLVSERGGRVVFTGPAPLLRLLSGCQGIDALVSQTAPPPPVDLHAELLSLPKLFGTTLATVPVQIPYLFAEAPRVARWRAELGAAGTFKTGFKIGIAWQGSPMYRADKKRSIPLEHFAPLASVPGVKLYSLQKGLGTEQLAAVAERFPVTDLGSTLDTGPDAFLDTAAVMQNLDLVVTSDTAIAHLAGGLGVPVWVALPYAADWRWLLEREDCPWYPTMRLFRQTEPGNWPEVFKRMAKVAGTGSSGRGTARVP